MDKNLKVVSTINVLHLCRWANASDGPLLKNWTKLAKTLRRGSTSGPEPTTVEGAADWPRMHGHVENVEHAPRVYVDDMRYVLVQPFLVVVVAHTGATGWAGPFEWISHDRLRPRMQRATNPTCSL